MKICILHRFTPDTIKETNASYPYLLIQPIPEFVPGKPIPIHTVDTLTFKKFNRIDAWAKYFKTLLWIFYAPFLVWKKNYDVIYCDDSFPFYPILIRLASPKSKIILRLGDLHLFYYFDGWQYKILHAIEKIGWDIADKILVISESMATYVLLETDTPVYVVLDPIDPKDFPIKVVPHSNKTIVMFHGTLTANKNIDILLEAARILPDISFIIIGDGPENLRLREAAPNNVGFINWLDHKSVYMWINHCDIGIALRGKNFGNELVVTSPFLQYSVMGKPCIVSHRQVFDDEKYGWQFDTTKELIEQIKRLSDKATAKALGDANRRYVLENHDAQKIAREIWSHWLS